MVSASVPESHTGIIIEKGELLPDCCLRAATVVGMRVSAAEFITTKRTVSLSAVSLLLIALILFMASIPRGVAAFPSPSRFAVIFAQMASPAGVL